MWSSLCRSGMGAIALSCGIGTAVSAVPQNYGVLVAESNVQLSTTIQGAIDANPDFTELLPGGDDFPMFASMAGSSNTAPSTDSTAIADVGLPGQFNSEITFSQLSIVLTQLPGVIEGFGIVPVPLDLTGSNNQLVAFFATLSEFRIDLNAPLNSALTPTGNLNEWLWAGLADVTVSGKLKPFVQIPTQADVPLGEFPFSQQVSALPLVGTFSGTNVNTTIAVGLQQGALQNQDLSLPPIAEVYDVGGLGLVTLLLNLREFTLVDISTAVVYQSPVPIPEPNTALLLALGLVGFAWRRRQ